MATLKALKKAAEEMNKLMGLKPPIGCAENAVADWEEVSDKDALAMGTAGMKKMDDEEIEDAIKAEGDDVVAEDKFSATTWKVLEGLGAAEKAVTKRNKKAGRVSPAAKAVEEDGDDEPEEEEEVKKTTKKKTTTKAKKPVAKKAEPKAKKAVAKKTTKKAEPKVRKPGVISTIIDLLEKKPITKEGILAQLVKKFPDREEESMSKTINVQVPNRIMKERGLDVVKDSKDRFSIK